MNWITIDQEKCTVCGLCAAGCPLCFRKKGDRISARADESNCNQCGHCVGLCPADAITHSEMDMGNFPEIGRGPGIGIGELTGLVRGRRSHRSFQEERIPRKDLETLVDICRYAPTGSNRQNLGILVIEDRQRIQRLSDWTVDYFAQSLGQMERDLAEVNAGRKEIPEALQPMYGMADTLKRIIKAREVGMEVIFHKAPAVMIFHAPCSTSTPKDDCVIASTTVVHAAQSLGLGTCYIGLFEFAANTHPPIVQDLRLPAGHRAYGVLVLGQPRLRFLRTVDRKPMRVRWE